MKKIINENYFLGNTGNPLATHSVIAGIPSLDFTEAVVGYDDEEEELDEHHRKSGVAVFPATGIVAEGVGKIINNCNKLLWNKNLKGNFEVDNIYYMIYNEPADHFAWHCDTYPGDPYEKSRVLSLSYCLSHASDYEGCEFCIGDEEFKMDFGDFIVFPSGVEHCVKPLVSGERKVLVAWYS